MMPNMMPKVGRGKAANVFYNTGHGHLGWTLSAVTADMVAENVKQQLTTIIQSPTPSSILEQIQYAK
jgi:D-amino-acid dehydrogenase